MVRRRGARHAAEAAAESAAPQVAWSSVAVDEAPTDVLPRKNSQRLGEQLLAKGAITADQLDEALLQQTDSGRRLGEVLVEIGLLDERMLAEVLAEQYGFSVVDLRPVAPAADALELIPESLARGMMAIPVRRADNRLAVVVADPSYPGLVGEPATGRGRRGPPGRRAGFARFAAPSTGPTGRWRASIGTSVNSPWSPAQPAAPAPTEVQQAVQANAPVVQVVNLIITQALRDRASDVHIEPQGDQVRVRMRDRRRAARRPRRSPPRWDRRSSAASRSWPG